MTPVISIIPNINKTMKNAMTKIATQAVLNIKNRISHEGSNHPPVHSKRGEPPFKISGDLQKSVDNKVGDDGDTVIFALAPYASILEDEALLDRPFMTQEFYRLEKELLEKVKLEFVENFRVG